MTGLLEALVALVIVFALAYGSVALVVVTPVAVVWAWKRHKRRKSFPRRERAHLTLRQARALKALSSSLKGEDEGAERGAP